MSSGARNIRTNFTAVSLTHFGGMYLLHQFLQRLKLRTYLSEKIKFPQRNNHYTLSELFLALMYPMILGLEKIEVSQLLKTNGVFCYLTGIPTFPDPTTLRRFLVRASPVILTELKEIHNSIRAHFLSRPSIRSSFWLDCDSTAQTLYGNQEGATKGYNPAHPGKKSYHPLVITEAHLGDCLAGLLRPGDAHTANGIGNLLVTILPFLPHTNRLRIRADAGFYDGDFIALLKEKSIDFVVVAHITSPLKGIIGGLRYKSVSEIFSVSELKYQPFKWKEKERFCVLRRKLPNEESPDQTTLFTLDRYAYSIVVTNLNLEPYNIFQFYQDRSAQERIIRTLKEDYPFGKAPTSLFAANAMYAELSLLAYNLITWFKRMCLPQDWQSFTLPTIRHRLLMIPGEFVKSKNIPTLRFPRNSPYQETFQYAQKQIKKLDSLA